MKTKAFGGGKKPADRASKICPVCQKSFTWRKKWAKDWENVIYCSERCKKSRGSRFSNLQNPIGPMLALPKTRD
jgi:hypothetical protein